MTTELERLAATVATLEQLLAVHEEVTSRQASRLAEAHAEVIRRAEQLEASRAALAANEARRGAIVAASLDAILAMDESGVITEFSPSAEVIFGYTRDEAVGSLLADLIVPPETREAHRAGLQRYMRTRQPRIIGSRIELTAMRKDGTTFPAEVAIVAVPQGEHVMFTGYARDISEQKRTALRLAHLQRVTDTALMSLTLDELLPELLDRVNEIMSPDTIAIMLIDDEGDLRLRAGRGLIESDERPYVLAIGAGVAGRAARDRSHAIVLDVATVPDADPILERSGVRSMLAVPLLNAGRLLGVLHVGSRDRREFTDEEATLLQLVGDRIAVSIEHARWYERERTIAHTLQMSLLPERLPAVPGIDVAMRYLPAGDGTRVGGDWFDVIRLADGRVGMAIGDVVGRGIRAASTMAQMRYAVRAYAADGREPDRVLERVDRLLNAEEQPEMATMLYAVYDPRDSTLSFSSAGHPPPLLAEPGSPPRFVEGGASLPVGVSGHAHYRCERIAIAPGSRLMLYTDGLIERRGEEFDIGMSRLAAVFADDGGPEATADAVLEALFPDGEPKDDVAFLVVAVESVAADTLRISMPGEHRSLVTMRARLDGWLRNAGVSDEIRFELLVAASEAATNAIEHAYASEPGGYEVEASIAGGEVTIAIRDRGRWRMPRPSRGGRGFQVMEAFSDTMTLTPRESGTEVVIRRRIEGGAR